MFTSHSTTSVSLQTLSRDRGRWDESASLCPFFLNMGDMLVKSGDWQTAQKIYANARLSRTYASWKYRSVLEDRIDRAQAKAAQLNAPAGAPGARRMIDSEFACTGCHQQ